MKIGILTYHRVINPGSVVQAWCSVKLMQELFPEAQVEVIDYRALRIERRELRKYITRRWPFFGVKHWAKTRSIRSFVASYLPMSADKYLGDDAKRAGEWIRAQQYDAILVGSDTVWELRNGAYSPDGANAYFLPFEIGGCKVSIAASMDPVPVFTQKQRQELQERISFIKQFDLISVRDEATRDVLVAHGVAANDMELVADPTLMVDWASLLEQPLREPQIQRLTCGVALPEDIAPAVHRVLAELGYEVWDWNGVNSPHCDYALPAGLPIGQRLALHAKIGAFVTDRFHGAIFSILLGSANVVFYESPAKWPTPCSKGRSLFQRAGIEASVVRETACLTTPAQLAELLSVRSGVKAREQLLSYGRHSRALIFERLSALI